MLLYCIVWHCIIQYCIYYRVQVVSCCVMLYCIVLLVTVSYHSLLCCIVWHGIVKHCIVSYRIVFNRIVPLITRIPRNKRNKSRLYLKFRRENRGGAADAEKAACGPTVISPCRDTSAFQTEPSDESHFSLHHPGGISL